MINEVSVLKKMRHYNVVRYYEKVVDSVNKNLYIVMEYIENGDLQKLIKKKKREAEQSDHPVKIEERFIWKVMIQTLQALNACHQMDDPILHRDIKPANIMLNKWDDVKLVDFGLSKELREEGGLAQTNVGTPYYMSPEIMGGKGYNDKADIWALGCILYEMAFLRVPFSGKNIMHLADGIKNYSPKWSNRKISDELKRYISAMLEKDPEKRPSAQTLLKQSKAREL